MPGNLINSSGKIYLSIVGGNVVQSVDKETPNARKREYERKDGTMGVKWELVYSNWTGVIQSITFKTTDYGEFCNIDLGDAQLSIPTTSRYFTDFACKIFNADLSLPTKLHPFEIEDEGKVKKGISVQQDGVKLKNYFWDGEKKLHGFPEVDEDRKDKKTYWKVYFAEVEEFLVDKVKNLKFNQPSAKPVNEEPEIIEEDYATDLPFGN